jgi:cation diffusion facilitator family transporter
MQVGTALRLSMATAVATIAMKTVAWWITDSVGLLSDAMESIVNLASALFAIAMVAIAARPADADHPFGHTKAEYFSSGFEGLMIAAAAVAIIAAAAHRLFHPQPLEHLGWGLALNLLSTVLNGVVARQLMITSREHRSIALEADARHLYTDVWTSIGVVVALVVVHFTGWLVLDPVIAIAVAANVLREGGKLVWRSVDGLMDKAVEPDVRAQIDRTLARFAHRTIRFDHVVTRRAGRRRFVDLHMHMPGAWTLRRAAALRGEVEQALMSDIHGLRASIQLLPSDVEAHFGDEDERP